MRAPRFTVYHLRGSSVQLRDEKPRNPGAISPPWIVATFPTCGGGFTTGQSPAQALRLARKIARLLNAPRE